MFHRIVAGSSQIPRTNTFAHADDNRTARIRPRISWLYEGPHEFGNHMSCIYHTTTFGPWICSPWIRHSHPLIRSRIQLQIHDKPADSVSKISKKKTPTSTDSPHDIGTRLRIRLQEVHPRLMTNQRILFSKYRNIYAHINWFATQQTKGLIILDKNNSINTQTAFTPTHKRATLQHQTHVQLTQRKQV